MAANLTEKFILIRNSGRDERGRPLSQSKFAAAINLDQSTLSRFEQGVGQPAMQKRLAGICAEVAKNPHKLSAYGINPAWFAAEVLELPLQEFKQTIGIMTKGPPPAPAPPPTEEPPVFSAEETSASTQRLSGCYRLLRWQPPSPVQQAAEVVEIATRRSQAEMRVRRMAKPFDSHELSGKLMICGAGFTVALHNTIPNGPTLSLNCIPDSNATVELMLGAATEAVGGFSAALSGAPAFLKRIHLPPGGKLDDAMRKMTEEFSDPVAAWEAEYKTLLSQYSKHFAFWTP